MVSHSNLGRELRAGAWAVITLCFLGGMAAIGRGRDQGSTLLVAIGCGLIGFGIYIMVQWFRAKSTDWK
jgi:hypothetical protein